MVFDIFHFPPTFTNDQKPIQDSPSYSNTTTTTTTRKVIQYTSIPGRTKSHAKLNTKKEREVLTTSKIILNSEVQEEEEVVVVVVK